MEAKFYFEKQELLTKIASLEEEILVKQHQLVEAENKIKHTVSFTHKFCLMKISSETLKKFVIPFQHTYFPKAWQILKLFTRNFNQTSCF